MMTSSYCIWIPIASKFPEMAKVQINQLGKQFVGDKHCELELQSGM